MREALRSAFEYGLVIPTAGVPAETLEAATLAAGDAAVAEGTKQLLEGKKSSPTARYLDDLSPGSGDGSGGGSGGGSGSGGSSGDGVVSSEAAEKKTADGLWMGAEAAAYAAGAAAGVSLLCGLVGVMAKRSRGVGMPLVLILRPCTSGAHIYSVTASSSRC